MGGPQIPSKAEAAWLARKVPDKNPRYESGDIGLALLLADYINPVARYVAERKQWYIYNDGVWSLDTGNLTVTELCKRLTNGLYQYSSRIGNDKDRREFRGRIKTMDNKHRRDTLLKDAASVYFVKFSQFDKDPYLLNCVNGTLNLKTGVFGPHNPSDLLTKMAGVKYDPNAVCTR